MGAPECGAKIAGFEESGSVCRAFHPTPPGLDASVPKARRQVAGSACALHGSSDRYLAKTKPNHSVAVADGLYMWERHGGV